MNVVRVCLFFVNFIIIMVVALILYVICNYRSVSRHFVRFLRRFRRDIHHGKFRTRGRQQLGVKGLYNCMKSIVQDDESYDFHENCFVQEAAYQHFEDDSQLADFLIHKDEERRKMILEEVQRLKDLEKMLKDATFEDFLRCLQNTAREKDQRVFGVKTNRGKISFLVTSKLLLELFVDVCGEKNPDYEPFFLDVKFRIGPFFGVIVGIKNVLLRSEPSTVIMFLLSTHHTHREIHTMWEDASEIVDISSIVCGVCDCEEGFWKGTKKFNPDIKLFVGNNHRVRAIKRWLKEHPTKYNNVQKESFLGDVIGSMSIYRHDFDLYKYELLKKSKNWGNGIVGYFRRFWLKKHQRILSSEKRKHRLSDDITQNLIESINAMVAHLLVGNMSPIDAVMIVVTFVTSNEYQFKRIVMGGGRTKFKQEYEHIREKYSRKFKIMYEVHRPVKTFNYQNSEDVKELSESLFKEIVDVLFMGDALLEETKTSIFRLCIEVSEIGVNGFFSNPFNYSCDDFGAYMYKIHDVEENGIVEVEIMYRKGKGGKWLVFDLCSEHGKDCLCPHTLFAHNHSQTIDKLPYVFKQESPLQLIQKYCSVSSGRKPGFNKRRRRRKRVGFFYKVFGSILKLD